MVDEPLALALTLTLELGVEVVVSASKGFDELPPVPAESLNAIVPIVSCCERLSEVLVESMGSPLLTDQIQALLSSVGLIDPPLQERQLSHRTLAVMDPSEALLEPARMDTWALEEPGDGWEWPFPSLGDSVTLPFPSAYTMKMLEPAIWLPWPRPIHCVPEGATSWK